MAWTFFLSPFFLAMYCRLYFILTLPKSNFTIKLLAMDKTLTCLEIVK